MALPFSFAWFVEEHDLVLFHYKQHGAFNWRVGSQRYKYELRAEPSPDWPARVKNVLTLTDGDQKLVFRRTLLQPHFDPQLGGLQLQLNDSQGHATRALILDVDGGQVLRVLQLRDIEAREGSYRHGEYLELPPGKYVVLAAAEERPLVRATVELVAGRERPVRIYFSSDAPRVVIAELRDKQGLRFAARTD